MVCRWVERDLCRTFQPQAPLLDLILGCSPKLLPSTEQGGEADALFPRPWEGEAGCPQSSHLLSRFAVKGSIPVPVNV